jgi:hypothetical protein
MMSYSHVHGLNPILDYDINTLAAVRVFDYTTLKEVAQKAGLDYETVVQLNPAFLKKYIPKSSKGYLLTLPEINMYNLLAQSGKWENLLTTKQHSKSLQQTYYRYGAMKKQLEELQPLVLSANFLKLETIDLNVEERSHQTLIGKLESDPLTEVRMAEGDYYRLKTNQSIVDVSRVMGIRLSKILALNDIDMNSLPPPGTQIRIK